MYKYKREKTRSIIESHWGEFCSVSFIKKDGSPRTMTGRLGVTVGVKGEDASESAKKALESWKLNPENQKYIRFYDFTAKAEDGSKEAGFRTINLDTITRIKVDKHEYLFEE